VKRPAVLLSIGGVAVAALVAGPLLRVRQERGSAPVALRMSSTTGIDSLEAGALTFDVSTERIVALPTVDAPATHELEVVDSVSQAPIAGVRIHANREGVVSLELTTDDRGQASLPEADVWKRLVCSVEGYFPISTTDVPSDDCRSRHAGLPHRLELAPCGTLVVQVVGESDQPLTNAYIQIFAWDSERRQVSSPQPFGWPRFVQLTGPARVGMREVVALTDARGRLVVEGLPVGRPLRVQASRGVSDCSALTSIDPVLRRTIVSLKGKTTAELSGRVLWEDGSPAAGVMVRIDPVATLAELRQTKADGGYTYLGVDYRSYELSVPSQRVSVSIDVDGAKVVAPDLRIPRTSPLTGTLTWGEGTAGQDFGHHLSVTASGERFFARAFPAADGSFALDVPEGPVALQVLDANWRSLWGAVVTAPCAPLSIDLARSSGVLVVRHPMDGTQGGRLYLFPSRLARDSRPEKITSYVFEHALAGTSRETVLTGLEPDEYRVLLVATDSGGAWSRPVRVARGVRAEIELPRPHWARLDGVVQGELDAGPAEVLTLGVDRALSSTHGDAAGEFSWSRLLPGPRLVYLALPGASMENAMAYLELGEDPVRVALRVPEVSRLAGTVTRGGVPVPGVTIYCIDEGVPEATGSELSGSTDDQGRYSFGPLPVGAHDVVFYEIGRSGPGGFIETRRVEIMAGRENALDLEWSLDARVELLDGEAPLANIRYARFFTPGGRSLVVYPDEDGRLPIGAPLESCVIQACIRGGDMEADEGGADREAYFATLEGWSGGEVQVPVGGGVLLVRHASGTLWTRPPVARVRSVNGICTLYAGQAFPLRRRYEGEGVYRFEGIPARTEVELVHKGPDGADVVQALYFPAEETREVELVQTMPPRSP
jgi:hypothetical protein